MKDPTIRERAGGKPYDVDEIRQLIDTLVPFSTRLKFTVLLADFEKMRGALKTARSYHAKECRCAVCPVLEAGNLVWERRVGKLETTLRQKMPPDTVDAKFVKHAIEMLRHPTDDFTLVNVANFLQAKLIAGQPAADEAPAPTPLIIDVRRTPHILDLLKKCAVALNHRGLYDDAQDANRRISEVGKEVDDYLHNAGVKGYGNE